MLEIKRVESIDAKPSEFHEIHEYMIGIDDYIDDVIVRLHDEETGNRIHIYYYLAKGLIAVFYDEKFDPHVIRFESGYLGSMYEAFDKVKKLVQGIIENEQS